jgi:hypothetical protein
VIATLSALLVGSNAWWAYKALDGGISYTYLSASYETASELSEQTKAIVQVLTQPSASKPQVLAAAARAAKSSAPYEKLGYTWVGQLGLKFNEHGRLVHVITSEAEAQ